MSLPYRCYRRVRAFFRRRELERDMAEEMRFHLEQRTAEEMADGLPNEAARYAAQRKFGGMEQLKEQARERHRFARLEQLGKDAVFTVRSLARARGFTLTVLAMLVLGIGIASFVFDLTAWILVFDQPYPHPEQLYLVGFKDKHSASNTYQPALVYHAYREQTTVFSEFAVVAPETGNLVIAGEPTVVSLCNISVDCFRTLGIAPVLGRGFLPKEYRPGANDVVVIADALWRNSFHASPDVLGRTVLVDQKPCTIVGVLAAGQLFPPGFGGDVYRPSTFTVNPAFPLQPTVYVIGRLQPGVPPEVAHAVLAGVALPKLPIWATAFLGEQEPQLMKLTEPARPELYRVMAAAAGLLYTIACLNAMNLTLVRLLGRRRELGIRLALGATRWQIARLVAIESVGLAAMASGIVAAAARWLFPLVLAWLYGEGTADYVATLDVRALGCIGVLTLVASLATVLVPVWRLLRNEINPGLKDGGTAGEGRGMARLRGLLVVVQAALALILLAGTGLMVRSIERLHRVDLGLVPGSRMKIALSFPRDYTLKPAARLQLFERLRDRLAALPGVKRAACGQDSLLTGPYTGTGQVLTPDGTYRSVVGTYVDENYGLAAGLILKRGHWLSAQRTDVETVINETMARTLYGDANPIGRMFKLRVTGDHGFRVVGVVGDARPSVRSEAGMEFYHPAWAFPMNVNTVVLQLDRDPGRDFAGLVRTTIYRFDPRLIVSQVSTVEEMVEDSLWAERYALEILQGLTLVAVGLAAVGLFSVVAYSVEMRMKEFGVRLALGAQPGDLHRLVLGRGLATAAIGIGLGVLGALVVTRFMQSLLFETSPYDWPVYVAVSVLLLGAAALACWLPARRAARVDVTKLLRTE